MSSYAQRILTDGERIVHAAHPSLWPRWLPILLGVVGIAAFGAGLLILGWIWLEYRATELTITNKRIIAKSGIFTHTSMEVRLDKVETVRVSQSLAGRLLGFGTVIIAGTGGDQLPVDVIQNPLDFQRSFTRALDERALPAGPR